MDRKLSEQHFSLIANVLIENLSKIAQILDLLKGIPLIEKIEQKEENKQ